MRRAHLQWIVGGMAVLMGCGDQADMPDVTKTTGAILHGSVTDTHPEVGFLNAGGGVCTATLVAPRWVLTAGHCINFSTNVPPNATFFTGLGTGVNTDYTYPIQQILDLGPPGPISGDGTAWTRSHVRYTTDSSGNDDLALLLLGQAVGSWATPGWIEHTVPPQGTPVSVMGYGISDGGVDDELKRVASWSVPAPGSAISFRDVVDENGTVTHGQTVLLPNMTDNGYTAEGDSGGPAFLGDASEDVLHIWGVTSMGSAFSTEFGSVAFLNRMVCHAAYVAEPHSFCTTGGPLFEVPHGCVWQDSAPTAEQTAYKVLASICSLDPYCCNPNTSWDSICVDEAESAAQVLGIPCP